MQHKTRIVIVVLFIFAALILSGCGFRQADAESNGEPEKTASTSSAAPAAAPASQEMSQPPQQAPAQAAAAPASNGGQWTPESKCSWLRANFPQSTKAVQAFGASLAKVAPERIRTHEFRCGREANAQSVFDGFIVLGPNEGFAGAVTLEVPAGGAIDAYAESCGASYSEPPTLINDFAEVCDDTWRATAGTVTGLSMTYWPFNDDAPPSGGASSSMAPASSTSEPVAEASADATVVCLAPADLVKSVNAKNAGTWVDHGMVDQKYGGMRIEVLRDSQLPTGWEAAGAGNVNIGADDSERTLYEGEFWSIYPPRGDCRKTLGFQD